MLQVMRVTPSNSSSSSAVVLQLLEGGQPVLGLTQSQVSSLVQLLDDLTTQLPGSFDLTRQVQVRNMRD